MRFSYGCVSPITGLAETTVWVIGRNSSDRLSSYSLSEVSVSIPGIIVAMAIDFIGHALVREMLERAVTEGRVRHAYLLLGPGSRRENLVARWPPA